MLNSIQIEQIKKKLKKQKNITFISHINPDGDAIGSMLGLSLILENAGYKNINLLSPSRIPSFLKWMKNADKIMIFDEKKIECKKIIADADLIFILDLNTIGRTGDAKDAIINNKSAFKIMIEHHPDPDKFCHITLSIPKASSTAEIVFKFLKQLKLQNHITESAAECFYSAIITDSGNFRFNTVSPELHTIVAELLKKRINHSKIHEFLYDSYSSNTLKLHGYILSNKMKYYSNYKAVILSISQQEIDNYCCTKDDIDEVVNYGLKIKGVEFSAFIYENDNKVRCAFRSKGKISCKDIAVNYFNGGGHLNASGGISVNTLDATIIFLEKLLPKIMNL